MKLRERQAKLSLIVKSKKLHQTSSHFNQFKIQKPTREIFIDFIII